MKAILVIDVDEEDIGREANYISVKGGGMSYIVGAKHGNVRLKPMPKELMYEGYDSPNKQIGEAILQSEWGKKAKKNDAICIRSFSIGYNACLEEIQK